MSEGTLFYVLSPQTGGPVKTGFSGRRHSGGVVRGGSGSTAVGRGHREILLGLSLAPGQSVKSVRGRFDRVVRTHQLFDRGDFRLFGHRVQVGPLARFRRPRRTVPAVRFEMKRRRHRAVAVAGQFRRSVGHRRSAPSRRGRSRVGGHRDRIARQRRRPSAAAAADFCGRAERAQRTLARVVAARGQARIARDGGRDVHAAVAAAASGPPVVGFLDVQVQRRRDRSRFLVRGGGSRRAGGNIHDGGDRKFCKHEKYLPVRLYFGRHAVTRGTRRRYSRTVTTIVTIYNNAGKRSVGGNS